MNKIKLGTISEQIMSLRKNKMKKYNTTKRKNTNEQL